MIWNVRRVYSLRANSVFAKTEASGGRIFVQKKLGVLDSDVVSTQI